MRASPVDVKRSAAEGNNHSYYLTEGVYETNYAFSIRGYQQAQKEAAQGDSLAVMSLGNLANFLEPYANERQSRVYLVMPRNISELNRQAEKEHCMDFVHAYDLTVGAMQAALQQVRDTDVGWFDSPLAARQAIEAELRRLLPPPTSSRSSRPGAARRSAPPAGTGGALRQWPLRFLPRAWSWRKALQIAHQGVRAACCRALRRQARDPHPSQKILMAPCRASIPPPFPMAQGIVPRRPARHASAHHEPAFGRWRGKRHEQTPLTPLTPCEAPSSPRHCCR